MSKARLARIKRQIAIGDTEEIRPPKVPTRKLGRSGPLSLRKSEASPSLYDSNRLPWRETYRSMAADPEDWSGLDSTIADGLD